MKYRIQTIDPAAISNLKSRLTGTVIEWCKENDCPGSHIGLYDLYRAVQDAVNAEVGHLVKKNKSK